MSLNTRDDFRELRDKKLLIKLLGAQLMSLSQPCLVLDLQNLLHIRLKLAHIFQQSFQISWQQRWVLRVALNSTILLLLSTSLLHILALNTLRHLITIEKILNLVTHRKKERQTNKQKNK